MMPYDDEFFRYVNSGAINSAEEILPLLITALSVSSVLDVGCGQGAWLSVWKKLGVLDVTGIDGDYVARDRLLINSDEFIPYDLSNRFSLNRSFDIVQSLEVAEHIHEDSAKTFIDNLVRHGDIVLFSAAPKGQGGDHHINEQNYEYWRFLFSEHGYQPVDYLRPLISGNSQIECWYRYNTLLYVSPESYEKLPQFIKECAITESDEIRDISPLVYKIRKKIISLLPVNLMTSIAKMKEAFITYLRSR